MARLIASTLVVFFSLILHVLAAADPQEPELRCKFSLEGREFNICPLFENGGVHKKIEIRRSTPPTVTTTTYRMSFHGPLRRIEELKDDEQVINLISSESVERCR